MAEMSLEGRISRLENSLLRLPQAALDEAREIMDRNYRLGTRIYQARLYSGLPAGEQPVEPTEEAVRDLALRLTTGEYSRQPIDIADRIREIREGRK